MRRSIRKAGVACGAFFASAALAMGTATGAQAVKTAVVVGGLGVPRMDQIFMRPLLGYKLDEENDILDDVVWPAEAGPYTGSGDMTLGQSITAGITALQGNFATALQNAGPGEQITVVGLSAGSLVVNDMMRLLVDDPNAPTKGEVKFILVADSSRQELIKDSTYNPRYDYTYRPAPETIYDIDVVTGEYDGMADLPDRWWNFLAVANAIVGGLFVHVPMMYEDYEELTPEENITRVTNSVGGTTTTYLVPTKTLPLVQLLPFLKSQEAELKAKIDKGYSRNDDRTATAALSLAAPAVEDASATVEDDADVEDTQDAAESDAAAGDTDESDTQTTKASKRDAVDEEDTDASKSDDDEAEATEDADEADSATADDGDEGDEDSTSTTDSDESGGSSSEGTGSSDSGSSE